MKACVLALLCAVLLCGQEKSSSASPNPSTLADLIDVVRPSVVKVAVVITRNNGQMHPSIPTNLAACFSDGVSCIVGTGFFVNSNGDIVTACHVVDGFRAKDGSDRPGVKQVIAMLAAVGTSSTIQIGIAFPNIERQGFTFAAGTNYSTAMVVATDPSHDLALIRPLTNPFTANLPMVINGGPKTKPLAVTFSSARPRDGESIFACGYPFGESGLVTTSGIVASAWNSRVLLRAEAAGFSFPVGVYDLNLGINPGNSGGPVFTTSKRSVVGVAVESLGSLGIAVPAKLVTAFLDVQSVPWTPVQAPPNKPRSPKPK